MNVEYHENVNHGTTHLWSAEITTAGKEVLVILFRGPEVVVLSSDFSHSTRSGVFPFFSLPQLLIIVVEDGGPVLRADIITLLVQLRGVMVLMENLKQMAERHLLGIIDDLHTLRVPSFPRAYILVRWVCNTSTTA